MVNDPYLDTGTLAGAARRHGKRLQRREELLRSFLKYSPLFLRLRWDIIYAGINNYNGNQKNDNSRFRRRKVKDLPF